MFDDETDDCNEEDFELTPIERAIYAEREMMRTIRKQQKEIDRLQAELARRATQALQASEERSALLLHAALSGAFTKGSVAAMSEDKPFTLASVLAADAAKREETPGS